MKKKPLLIFLSVFSSLLSTVSCSNDKETRADFFNRNVINLYKNEFYVIDVDWTDYSFEVENENIIRIDKKNRKIYGLQEGKADVIIKSADGTYDKCIVNVISRNDIKSIEDIYAIDENEMNFITLCVAENEDGIIRYMSNVYEGSEIVAPPLWTETVLYTKEGVWNYNTKSYEIISIIDNVNISPEDLEYGDVIICHYDYKGSEVYSGLPSLNVYNLYYTGLKNEELKF